jgi:hypothetical protein
MLFVQSILFIGNELYGTMVKCCGPSYINERLELHTRHYYRSQQLIIHETATFDDGLNGRFDWQYSMC